MTPVREVFAGLFFLSTFMVAMSAVLFLRAPYEGDRAGAWFWAVVFAASSLAADCCFWGLLGGVS